MNCALFFICNYLIMVDRLIHNSSGEIRMGTLIEEIRAYGADVDGALERFLDDEDLYEKCLLTFVDDESFAGLKEALDGKDYEQAFNCAHTLKGVAANLGLTPLYEAIVGIVEPLRGKDYSNLDSQYAVVAEAYEVFKNLMA